MVAYNTKKSRGRIANPKFMETNAIIDVGFAKKKKSYQGAFGQRV